MSTESKWFQRRVRQRGTLASCRVRQRRRLFEHLEARIVLEGSGWSDLPGTQHPALHATVAPEAKGVSIPVAQSAVVVPSPLIPGEREEDDPNPGAGNELIGVDFGPPADPSPTNWNFSDGTVLTLNNLIDESGAATSIDLNITSDGNVLPDTGDAPVGEIPQHSNSLTEIDGNIWVSLGTQITLSLSDLVPLGTYEVYLFGLDTASLDNTVTITGDSVTAFGQATTAHSLMVNDELGDNSRNLSTFAELITASATGTIAIDVQEGSGFGGIGGVAIRAQAGGPVNQFVVNSTLDTSDANLGDGSCDDGSGNCTLRAAIQQANALPNLAGGPDSITFNIPGAGPHTIQPLSGLPAVSEAADIDARTEIGYAGIPLVEVSGNLAGSGVSGLTIVSGNSSVYGLAINRFAASGIVLSTGGSNTVQENMIGTDPSGSVDQGNTSHGVTIFNSADNDVGGTTPAQGNVISGNDVHGVYITGAASSGNVVKSNIIGLAQNGNNPLGNGGAGVRIDQGASGNDIGGSGNVISSNGTVGVQIVGGSTTANTLAGNTIGSDISGMLDRGNAGAGVVIEAAPGNTVGVPGDGNQISGNALDGVFITGAGANNNLVQGNRIGLNLAGTAALANGQSGISLFEAPGNTLGGTSAGAGNVISGNARNGVFVAGTSSTGNRIEGNLIGTNDAGTSAVGNSAYGVLLRDAPNNTVGGTTAAAGNVISGNALNGLGIINNAATGNVASGNLIGTNAAGTGDLGNGVSGVLIWKAPSNRIGGLTAGERNVISGNDLFGVRISAPAATGNVLQGNFIGTNAAGTAAIPNSDTGVHVANGQTNTIGGTTVGARNVISGNGNHGVVLVGAGVVGNLVQGNFIGTNAAGSAALGNGSVGVLVNQGARNNTIGGSVAGAGNVISGNATDGVSLLDAGTRNNTVAGNLIGTNAAGLADLGNQRSGVAINDAHTNTIGGTTTAARNVISGNDVFGVVVAGNSATGNLIRGNFIGTDVSGSLDLGNTSTGVLISAPSNTIGGTASGAGNLISGNDFLGVRLNTSSATGNLVQGNFVGTQAGGVLPLGNSSGGIRVDGGSSNTVGGTTAGAGNVIAHNSNHGVAIIGGGTGNRIQRNSTFFNTGLGIDLNLDGLTANDPNDPDAGSNRLQNFPDIAAIAVNGSNLDITYSVPSSVGNATYPLTIEFFLADAANQEGQVFLGSDTYLSTSAGLPKLATIAAGAASGGSGIVATATDANGNTSEFSLNGIVPGGAPYVIGQNFSGSSFGQSGFTPPDTMGAVGPSHIVEILNGRYAVYTKTGGFVTGSSLDQFWINAGVTPVNFSFDPRILYDSFSSRWFAVAVDNSRNANNFLVAVSNSSNPTSGWTGFQIDADSDNTHWADFPMLGINQDVVVVQANMFGIVSAPSDKTTLVLPKSDLLAATPSVANGSIFEETAGTQNPGFSAQPAVDLDNGNLPLNLLSSWNKPAGFLRVSSIGGTAASPTLTAGAFVSVTARNSPPDIDQPGPKEDVDASNNRFSGNVVQQQIPGRTNPSLWGAHGVDIGGRAAIEWYEIDAVTNALLQNGTISDASLAFNYPSIAVNDFGDAVIGFSGGDPSNFMGTYVAVGKTVAGVTTFDSPLATKVGVADYERLDGSGRNRWGDYSATVVDPTNQRHFWTFQEFVAATDVWQIQITEIVVSAADEAETPSQPSPLVVSAEAVHSVNIGTSVVETATASVPSQQVISPIDGESSESSQAVSNSPWQNPADQLDVTDDQVVSPRDALVLINFINSIGAVRLDNVASDLAAGSYVDVNGDRVVSSVDALQLINALNESAASASEGEGLTMQPPTAFESSHLAPASTYVSWSLVPSFQPVMQRSSAPNFVLPIDGDLLSGPATSLAGPTHHGFGSGSEWEHAEAIDLELAALDLQLAELGDLLTQLAVDFSISVPDRQWALDTDNTDGAFADYEPDDAPDLVFDRVSSDRA